MPAFCADYFGPREVGSIYGLMLTAWGCGSALDPILIAHLRQSTGEYEQALLIIAAIMVCAAVVPLFLRAPVRVNAAPPQSPSDPVPLVCS
jgi:OFA family oxalate/formate antiporter-like MFS transporter